MPGRHAGRNFVGLGFAAVAHRNNRSTKQALHWGGKGTVYHQAIDCMETFECR